MDISKFEKVSTLIFARIKTNLPFDVYLQINDEKFTKIFSKDQPIDTERLENYVLRGVQHFHILKDDRPVFMQLTSELLQQYASSHDFVKEEAQHILDETAEKVLADILAQTVLTTDHLKYSKGVIHSYIEITGEKAVALPNILKLAKTKKSILRHSIMTSIFSTLLARAIEPKNPRFWFNAGLAAFLHDVGLSKVSEDVDEHNLHLSPEIKTSVERHPFDSSQMLLESGIDPEIIDAIINHHEYWDGTGYPKGLTKNTIPKMARLLTLADHFAGLINSKPSSPGLPPQIAFEALKKSTKFDPDFCMILGQTLRLS